MKVSTQMTYIDVAYAITVIVRFFDVHAQSMEGKINRGKECWNDAQKKVRPLFTTFNFRMNTL